MKGKKSFLFYNDWSETFDSLPDEKAGQLIKHILRYVKDENPTSDDLLINAVFANIKATLKRDLDKWKDKSLKNSKNASMRWHANASDGIKRNANNADKDNVKDNVKDKEGIPPLELFLDYAIEKKPTVDQEAVKLKYQSWLNENWSNGKGRKIKNWKTSLLNTLPYLPEKKKVNGTNAHLFKS